jgi:hypothetical protein
VSLADVLGAAERIFAGGDSILFDGARLLKLLEITFEVGDAPAAPGPRAATIADLTGASGLFDAQIVHNLSLRNVKAITDGVVEQQWRVLERKKGIGKKGLGAREEGRGSREEDGRFSMVVNGQRRIKH